MFFFFPDANSFTPTFIMKVEEKQKVMCEYINWAFFNGNQIIKDTPFDTIPDSYFAMIESCLNESNEDSISAVLEKNIVPLENEEKIKIFNGFLTWMFINPEKVLQSIPYNQIPDQIFEQIKAVCDVS